MKRVFALTRRRLPMNHAMNHRYIVNFEKITLARYNEGSSPPSIVHRTVSTHYILCNMYSKPRKFIAAVKTSTPWKIHSRYNIILCLKFVLIRVTFYINYIYCWIFSRILVVVLQ